MDDVFEGNGIEIELVDEEAFLKVKETLTRIGIASNETKTLFQSCHILHKRGRYAIVHFKEIFKLDGRQSSFNEDDKARRNLIVKLLQDWGLVTIIDVEKAKSPIAHISKVKVLPYKDKASWKLEPKYTLGRR